MLEERTFTFTAKLWRWQSETATAWHLITLPTEPSDAIKFFFPRKGTGFGSIRVEVTIGGSQWRTSIFPDSKSGAFVLPVKAAMRKAEKITAGDEVKVKLRII